MSEIQSLAIHSRKQIDPRGIHSIQEIKQAGMNLVGSQRNYNQLACTPRPFGDCACIAQPFVQLPIPEIRRSVMLRSAFKCLRIVSGQAIQAVFMRTINGGAIIIDQAALKSFEDSDVFVDYMLFCGHVAPKNSWRGMQNAFALRSAHRETHFGLCGGYGRELLRRGIDPPHRDQVSVRVKKEIVIDVVLGKALHAVVPRPLAQTRMVPTS